MHFIVNLLGNVERTGSLSFQVRAIKGAFASDKFETIDKLPTCSQNMALSKSFFSLLFIVAPAFAQSQLYGQCKCMDVA